MKKIYVVGYPRSGNVWLSCLLGDALDARVFGTLDEIGTRRESDDRYEIYQRHLKQLPSDGKTVFIYRDPRDVIVSMAHFWHNGNVNKVLNTADRNCVLFGWPRMMEQWINRIIPTDAVSYESLYSNTFMEFDRILLHLGIDLPDYKMREAVDRQTSMNKKRILEEKRLTQLGNNGIQGEYKRKLTCEQGRKIHEYLWPWLKRLDYETNDKWYEDLWKPQPELL